MGVTHLWPIALLAAFELGGPVWDAFWYAFAYCLYVWAGFLAISALPMAKK